MSSLQDLYGSLLGTQVGIFAIIVGVLLVYFQIIYSQFSYDYLKKTFFNKFLLLYILLSLLSIFMTLIPWYLLTISTYDFFPNIDLNSIQVISHNYFPLLCIGVFILSILMFFLYLLKVFKYLNPQDGIALIFNNISYEEIRDFLFQKYDLQIPWDQDLHQIRVTLDSENISDEELKKSEKLQEEAKIREAVNNALVSEIRLKVAGKTDPFDPIKGFIFQFIQRFDLIALEKTNKHLTKKFEEFVNTVTPVSEKWKPEDGLVEKLVKHYLSLIESAIEISDKQNLESGKNLLIKLSSEVLTILLKRDYFNEGLIIIVFWERFLKDEKDISALFFDQIMQYFRNLKEYLLEHSTHSEEVEAFIEEVSKSLGGICYRLLDNSSFETKVYVTNIEDSDKLSNCLFSILEIGDLYEKNPSFYPLFYYDTLKSIVEKSGKMLSTEYKHKEVPEFFRHLFFEVSYNIRKLAEAQISSNNPHSAALSILKLKEIYLVLKEYNLDYQAHEIMVEIVPLAFYSYVHKVDNDSLVGGNLNNFLIDFISETRENIDKEVREQYISNHNLEHTKVWEFVKKIGRELNTNFGFMFEPTTGEDYPPNDTRRKTTVWS
ncbi:hypothetical protein KBH77_04025 [Patescibacteria group bacterium]|nr:hypothetical protein [Patescibacteria group bacterium]